MGLKDAALSLFSNAFGSVLGDLGLSAIARLVGPTGTSSECDLLRGLWRGEFQESFLGTKKNRLPRTFSIELEARSRRKITYADATLTGTEDEFASQRIRIVVPIFKNRELALFFCNLNPKVFHMGCGVGSLSPTGVRIDGRYLSLGPNDARHIAGGTFTLNHGTTALHTRRIEIGNPLLGKTRHVARGKRTA